MKIKRLLVYALCVGSCLFVMLLMYKYHLPSRNLRLLRQTSLNNHDLPLLTLFTTFQHSPERNHVQRNTILNWALFGQDRVTTVLFSNRTSGYLENIALGSGWKVVPQQRVNKAGIPFLKDMYYAVLKRYKSKFVAFVNGDILFEENLIDTLRCVERMLKELNSTLIVGRRRNYLGNYTDTIYSHGNVSRMAAKSKLYRTDAQDYFIVTRNFPWANLKDVVIGRPGYDNYIVGSAIKLGVSTIDATATLTALHQHSKPYKGHDRNYNKKVIGKFNWGSGMTGSCKMKTMRDSSGEVILRRR